MTRDARAGGRPGDRDWRFQPAEPFPIELPDGRTMIVAAEDRLIIVAGEDRLILVPSEDRETII